MLSLSKHDSRHRAQNHASTIQHDTLGFLNQFQFSPFRIRNEELRIVPPNSLFTLFHGRKIHQSYRRERA